MVVGAVGTLLLLTAGPVVVYLALLMLLGLVPAATVVVPSGSTSRSADHGDGKPFHGGLSVIITRPWWSRR